MLIAFALPLPGGLPRFVGPESMHASKSTPMPLKNVLVVIVLEKLLDHTYQGQSECMYRSKCCPSLAFFSYRATKASRIRQLNGILKRRRG